MITNRPLTELTERELDLGDRPQRRRWLTPRAWLALAVAAVLASLWSAGVGRRSLLNPGGWTLVSRFFTAAVHPELSPAFLVETVRASMTTVAFAVLGTALAVLVGVVGGVLTSETWWRRSRPAPDRNAPSVRRGWYAGRTVIGLPRGIHEAVWGLFLVNIFGRDPLVAILAIAIPFGAITAKVYAELIDEAAAGPFDAFRGAGAGRTAALAYGVFPLILPDLISYAFYRLECSIRSAVILGMIGAGGLGFQLSLSFQSLRYTEMWTLIYALVAISALADQWGATLRRRPTTRRVRGSMVLGAVLVVASFVHVHPHVLRVVSARTRSLFADIAARSWPPSLPTDGWSGLVHRSYDTFIMSLLAIAIASSAAMLVAFIAARGGNTWPRRLLSTAARGVLLLARAIPAPVWALLVLFVMFPGPLPGAVALGIYNFGILGRLMAEVVENIDPRPQDALAQLGAPRFSALAYATLPQSVTRFTAYALYRWEVALRETVIVGVVGAGGLGRLLEQQRAAFDYAGMLGTVLALIVLSLVIDWLSAAARRSLR